MLKKWLLVCLTLILSGCVTAESLKKVPDERLDNLRAEKKEKCP